jgi:hypothetical protein
VSRCPPAARRRVGRFSAVAVLAKEEVVALCCTLAEAERLLAVSAPQVCAEAADARELLEGRLAG